MRTWLVTGAASGLGREIARAALGEGDTAMLIDRRTQGARELVSAYPGRTLLQELDVDAQPGAMRFAGASISESEHIADYESTVGELRAHVEEVTGRRPDDPAKIAAAVLAAPAADDTPLQLALGNDAFDRLTAAAEQTEQERIAWESLSRGTDFDV